MESLTKLFKLDSKGKLRFWQIHVDRDKYFTTSGLVDSLNYVRSGETQCFPKNVGRKNETTAEEQAVLEARSLYKKKIDREKYSNNQFAAITHDNFFSPTGAKVYQDRREIKKLSFPYLGSPKLDGVRGYTKHYINNRVEVLSKKHKIFQSCDFLKKEINLLSYLICEKINPLFSDCNVFTQKTLLLDVYLDGELYNHEFKFDFEKIASLVKKEELSEEEEEEVKDKIQFHIFDFCNFHKKSIYAIERFRILEEIFNENDFKYFRLVDQVYIRNEEEAREFKNRCKRLGYEGAMLKRPKSQYETKKTFNLLKYKDFKDEEFEILDFIEGKGSWSGAAKSVLCKNKEGVKFKAGIMGSMEYAKKLLVNKNSHICKLATIRYQDLTSKNRVPRFGRMVAIRDYE